jgi:hypothetical protein
MDSPGTVAVIDVIERHLSSMLVELRQIFASGPSGETAAQNGTGSWNWVETERLEGQSYTWPEENGGLENYDPFVVYRSNGLMLAVAELTNARERAQTWVFKMSDDLASKRPVTPFLAADDYADTGEMISLIRGKGETGRKMFGPGDVLPAAYDGMRIELQADRKQGGYQRYCVVAHKDDAETMLRHCAAQVQLRQL